MAGREELDGLDFPSEVQLAIDDLAGSMREGLLALSVGEPQAPYFLAGSK